MRGMWVTFSIDGISMMDLCTKSG